MFRFEDRTSRSSVLLPSLFGQLRSWRQNGHRQGRRAPPSWSSSSSSSSSRAPSNTMAAMDPLYTGRDSIDSGFGFDLASTATTTVISNGNTNNLADRSGIDGGGGGDGGGCCGGSDGTNVGGELLGVDGEHERVGLDMIGGQGGSGANRGGDTGDGDRLSVSSNFLPEIDMALATANMELDKGLQEIAPTHGQYLPVAPHTAAAAAAAAAATSASVAPTAIAGAAVAVHAANAATSAAAAAIQREGPELAFPGDGSAAAAPAAAGTAAAAPAPALQQGGGEPMFTEEGEEAQTDIEQAWKKVFTAQQSSLKQSRGYNRVLTKGLQIRASIPAPLVAVVPPVTPPVLPPAAIPSSTAAAALGTPPPPTLGATAGLSTSPGAAAGEAVTGASGKENPPSPSPAVVAAVHRPASPATGEACPCSSVDVNSSAVVDGAVDGALGGGGPGSAAQYHHLDEVTGDRRDQGQKAATRIVRHFIKGQAPAQAGCSDGGQAPLRAPAPRGAPGLSHGSRGGTPPTAADAPAAAGTPTEVRASRVPAISPSSAASIQCSPSAAGSAGEEAPSQPSPRLGVGNLLWRVPAQAVDLTPDSAADAGAGASVAPAAGGPEPRRATRQSRRSTSAEAPRTAEALSAATIAWLPTPPPNPVPRSDWTTAVLTLDLSTTSDVTPATTTTATTTTTTTTAAAVAEPPRRQTLNNRARNAGRSSTAAARVSGATTEIVLNINRSNGNSGGSSDRNASIKRACGGEGWMKSPASKSPPRAHPASSAFSRFEAFCTIDVVVRQSKKRGLADEGKGLLGFLQDSACVEVVKVEDLDEEEPLNWKPTVFSTSRVSAPDTSVEAHTSFVAELPRRPGHVAVRSGSSKGKGDLVMVIEKTLYNEAADLYQGPYGREAKDSIESDPYEGVLPDRNGAPSFQYATEDDATRAILETKQPYVDGLHKFLALSSFFRWQTPAKQTKMDAEMRTTETLFKKGSLLNKNVVELAWVQGRGLSLVRTKEGTTRSGDPWVWLVTVIDNWEYCWSGPGFVMFTTHNWCFAGYNNLKKHDRKGADQMEVGRLGDFSTPSAKGRISDFGMTANATVEGAQAEEAAAEAAVEAAHTAEEQTAAQRHLVDAIKMRKLVVKARQDQATGARNATVRGKKVTVSLAAWEGRAAPTSLEKEAMDQISADSSRGGKLLLFAFTYLSCSSGINSGPGGNQTGKPHNSGAGAASRDYSAEGAGGRYFGLHLAIPTDNLGRELAHLVQEDGILLEPLPLCHIPVNPPYRGLTKGRGRFGLDSQGMVVGGLHCSNKPNVCVTVMTIPVTTKEAPFKVKSVSVPAPSPSRLRGEFDRIVRTAYTAYAKSQARVMPGKLQRDLQDDLTWALMMTEFSSKLQGSFSQLEVRNSGAIQLQEIRKETEAADKREKLARQEKQRAEKAEQAAKQKADREKAAAEEARREAVAQRKAAARLAAMPQFLPSPYSQPFSFAPQGVPMYPTASYGASPMPMQTPYGGARFYRGGVFIPGGGRAPRSGMWM
eukprot:g9568.t1